MSNEFVRVPPRFFLTRGTHEILIGPTMGGRRQEKFNYGPH